MASVSERVIDIVSEQLGVNKEQVSRETSFVNDLGADSLDTVELVMELEEDGFIADGTFKNETFEKDKNAILDFYKNQGFLDAELEDPERLRALLSATAAAC